LYIKAITGTEYSEDFRVQNKYEKYVCYLEALHSGSFTSISDLEVGPMNYVCIGYFSSM